MRYDSIIFVALYIAAKSKLDAFLFMLSAARFSHVWYPRALLWILIAAYDSPNVLFTNSLIWVWFADSELTGSLELEWTETRVISFNKPVTLNHSNPASVVMEVNQLSLRTAVIVELYLTCD